MNLKSFKRRVTPTAETIGGPVDVAVISKGDGLVWLKRKHYFPPELNPRYFRRLGFEVPGSVTTESEESCAIAATARNVASPPYGSPIRVRSAIRIPAPTVRVSSRGGRSKSSSGSTTARRRASQVGRDLERARIAHGVGGVPDLGQQPRSTTAILPGQRGTSANPQPSTPQPVGGSRLSLDPPFRFSGGGFVGGCGCFGGGRVRWGRSVWGAGACRGGGSAPAAVSGRGGPVRVLPVGCAGAFSRVGAGRGCQ